MILLRKNVSVVFNRNFNELFLIIFIRNKYNDEVEWAVPVVVSIRRRSEAHPTHI